jgi:16S rRNA processing protein RimM
MKKHAFIIVGDIVNTHGLQGEVRVLSDSDFKAERFVKGQSFYIIDTAGAVIDRVTLTKYRTHKNFDLLTFEGKPSINDVESYKGYALAIDKAEARPLDATEGYYYAEIMASNVYNEAGVFIGQVHKIDPTPAYDLWYIKRTGKKDIIIPFTEHFVKSIDTEADKIIVHLIEGME